MKIRYDNLCVAVLRHECARYDSSSYGGAFAALVQLTDDIRLVAASCLTQARDKK